MPHRTTLHTLLAAALLLGGACDPGDGTGSDTSRPTPDSPPEGDSTAPEPERCDGVDNDGDGEIDEDALDATTWYQDADGDEYGVSERTVRACAPPLGYSPIAGDCDDSAAKVNPGALQDCASGADEDCDGLAGCEDGDCALEPVCGERCSDGLDNDLDGVTDCLDDECWADCAITARSQLRGGAASLSNVSFAASSSGGTILAGAAWSLSGSVSVQYSSGSFVCDWWVAQVNFTQVTTYDWGGYSTFAGRHAPYAMTLSSGCPVSSWDVLPPDLVYAGDSVSVPTGPWYLGPVSARRAGRWRGYRQDSHYQRVALDALSPATATWTPTTVEPRAWSTRSSWSSSSR